MANASVAPLTASSVTDVDLEAGGSTRPVSQRETHEVGAALRTPIPSPFPGVGGLWPSGDQPRTKPWGHQGTGRC